MAVQLFQFLLQCDLENTSVNCNKKVQFVKINEKYQNAAVNFPKISCYLFWCYNIFWSRVCSSHWRRSFIYSLQWAVFLPFILIHIVFFFFHQRFLKLVIALAHFIILVYVLLCIISFRRFSIFLHLVQKKIPLQLRKGYILALYYYLGCTILIYIYFQIFWSKNICENCLIQFFSSYCYLLFHTVYRLNMYSLYIFSNSNS